ncbi:hypothetical protein ACFLU6_03130 [Acidobacteriota bacterium]
MVNFNRRLTKKFDIDAEFLYVWSKGAMDEIMYDISDQAQAALPDDDYDFSEVHMYSDLFTKRIDFSVGGLYRVKQNLSVHGSFAVADFDDQAPYLFDTSGRMYLVQGNLIYTF